MDKIIAIHAIKPLLQYSSIYVFVFPFYKGKYANSFHTRRGMFGESVLKMFVEIKLDKLVLKSIAEENNIIKSRPTANRYKTFTR